MSDFSIRINNKELKKLTKDIEKTKENGFLFKIFDTDQDGRINVYNTTGENEINSLWEKLVSMKDKTTNELTQESIQNAIDSDESLTGLSASDVFGFFKKVATEQEIEFAPLIKQVSPKSEIQIDLSPDEVKEFAMSSLYQEADQGAKIFKDALAHDGLLKEGFNQLKELFGSDIAASKINRVLIKEKFTSDILMLAQDKDNILTNEKYYALKLSLAISLTPNYENTEELKNKLLSLTPPELEYYIEKLFNMENNDYRSFDWSDSIEKIIKNRIIPEKTIKDISSDEKLKSEPYNKTFEELFKQERGIPYNHKAVENYLISNAKWQAVNQLNNQKQYLHEQLGVLVDVLDSKNNVIDNSYDIKSLKNLKIIREEADKSSGKHELSMEEKRMAQFLLRPSLGNILDKFFEGDIEKITKYLKEILKRDDLENVVTKDNRGIQLSEKLKDDDLIRISKELVRKTDTALKEGLGEKNLTYYQTQVENDYKKAFGNKSSSLIAQDYQESQTKAAEYTKAGLQYYGMGIMIGGTVLKFPPAVILGAGLGSTLVGSAIDTAEAITRTATVSEAEKRQIKEEVFQNLALFGAGMGVGKISGTVFENLAQKCPMLLAKSAEIGVDATLSIITTAMITGEIDLKGETISQILSTLAGALSAKVKSIKAKAPEKAPEKASLDAVYAFNPAKDAKYTRAPKTDDIDNNPYFNSHMQSHPISQSHWKNNENIVWNLDNWFYKNIIDERITYDELGDFIDYLGNFKDYNLGTPKFNNECGLEILNFAVRNDISIDDVKKIIENNQNGSVKEIIDKIRAKDFSPLTNKNSDSYTKNRQKHEELENILITHFRGEDFTKAKIKLLKLFSDPKAFEAVVDSKYFELCELKESFPGKPTWEEFLHSDINFQVSFSKSYLADIKRLYEIHVEKSPQKSAVTKDFTDSHLTEEQIKNKMLEDSDIKNGEIASIGEKLYYYENGKINQLGISKSDVDRLFPLGERFKSSQGELGNCWFISFLQKMTETPKGRRDLYKLFTKNDDGSITIKFPVAGEGVTFRDGIPVKMKRCGLSGCDGLKMIEQAYAVECLKINPDNRTRLFFMDKELIDKYEKTFKGTLEKLINAYNDFMKSGANEKLQEMKDIVNNTENTDLDIYTVYNELPEYLEAKHLQQLFEDIKSGKEKITLETLSQKEELMEVLRGGKPDEIYSSIYKNSEITGVELDVYNLPLAEYLGEIKKHLDNNELVHTSIILDKFKSESFDDETIKKLRDIKISEPHSYFIRDIDVDNGFIYLLNPHNSEYMIKIDAGLFRRLFNGGLDIFPLK